MILKALYDYYQRLGDKVPMGFGKKDISFVVIIDECGKLKRIEDTRDGKNAKSFILPRAVIRSSGIAPNLLWDNGQYVLGIPKEADKKASNQEQAAAKEKKNAEDRRDAFAESCRKKQKEFPDSKELKALVAFYDNKEYEKVKNLDNWEDILKTSTSNFSFQLEHSLKLIAENTEYNSPVENEESNNESSICLITGVKGKCVRVTSPTAINKDSKALVSFQVKSGYDSYGKEQCANAPISEDAEFAYTTALNKLLAKGSRNCVHLKDRTFVFWASSSSKAAEDVEESLFSFVSYNEDDPNKNIAKVKQLFKSVWSGIEPTTSDDRFYVLGLAPNSARIAVVYWNECSLKEFAGKMLLHFDDMEIVDSRKDGKPYSGIYTMLSAVTLGGKVSDAQPNLPEAVLKSIIQGLAYPFPLYSSCIRRIHAEVENGVTIGRMAIIKAYLNRIQSNEKKIEIMLDKENTNVGYLCGRLFAVLDKIQEDANNIHTMRERYMTAASTTPSTVFATTLNLSAHHAEKLNERAQVFYEKLKQEIISALPADGFPSHLDLQEQGRFFVGYYHQRQDLFTKKDNNKVESNE